MNVFENIYLGNQDVFMHGVQPAHECDYFLSSLLAKLRGKYDYVDLGLPSRTLWATSNVGTLNPDELGECFRLFEVEPIDFRSVYDKVYTANPEATDIDYAKGLILASPHASMTINKEDQSEYIYFKYSDSDDYNQCIFDNVDDTCFVNMGSNWSIPTTEQIKELFENCDYRFLGSKIIFTSKLNGEKLYFPTSYKGAQFKDSDFINQIPNHIDLVSKNITDTGENILMNVVSFGRSEAGNPVISDNPIPLLITNQEMSQVELMWRFYSAFPYRGVINRN